MPKFEIISQVNEPFDLVKQNFDQNLFEFLVPKFPPTKLLRFDGCKKNDEVHLRMFLGQTWTSLITENIEKEGYWLFVDQGMELPWPLKSWRHEHHLVKNDNYSTIIDKIEFNTQQAFLDNLILPILKRVFAARKSAYKKYFNNIGHY